MRGVTYTLLRNGWYTENFADEAHAAIDTGLLASAADGGRVASATRADYALAAANVLLSDGQYNDATLELSGDSAWTYADLAATLSTLSGKHITYKDVSSEELRQYLRDNGTPEAGIAWSVKLAEDIAHGALGHQSGELSSIIGRPTTPLEETLR